MRSKHNLKKKVFLQQRFAAATENPFFKVRSCNFSFLPKKSLKSFCRPHDYYSQSKSFQKEKRNLRMAFSFLRGIEQVNSTQE